MIAPHATPHRLATGVSRTDSRTLSLHGAAAATLMVLLMVLLVMWPIPHLGFSVDLATGMITEVVPGSAADRAHLVVSDRIVGMYDYAWTDIERRLFLYPISWQAITSVPAHLERDGQILSVNIPADPPTLDFQVEKVAGDAIMAYWQGSDAPQAEGNLCAYQACYTALQLRGIVKQFVSKSENWPFPDFPLWLDLALATGPVAAGVLGAAKANPALLGDTANLAFRLEKMIGADSRATLLWMARLMSSSKDTSALIRWVLTRLKGVKSL